MRSASFDLPPPPAISSGQGTGRGEEDPNPGLSSCPMCSNPIPAPRGGHPPASRSQGAPQPARAIICPGGGKLPWPPPRTTIQGDPPAWGQGRRRTGPAAGQQRRRRPRPATHRLRRGTVPWLVDSGAGWVERHPHGRSSFWQAVAACATPGQGRNPRRQEEGRGQEEHRTPDGLPPHDPLRDAQAAGQGAQLLQDLRG